MTKVVDEKIDEGVLRWFGHVEGMENDRIIKSVYLGKCAGSRSGGRWFNVVKYCLNKRSLDFRQARRMVHDRSICRWFVRGNAWGVARGMNP